MLAELRCGSSCASSESNPGARRTIVAQSSPPSSAVATIASPCRAIFRPSMVCYLLIGGSAECLAGLLAGGSFRMVDLLHGIHSPIGFGQESLDICTVLRAERHADTQRDHISATD